MTCSHEQVHKTRSGRVYCLLCGDFVGEPYQIPSRWEAIDLGAVALPHKVYIGASFNAETNVWMLGRVQWCTECNHFEVYQEGLGINHRDHERANISHIAEDTLGVPYDAPSQLSLPSDAG